MNPIQDDLDQIDTEKYLMQLAFHQGNLEVVEYHANKIISLAGSVRRECFLETHRSGEVK